jgi:hypothetical protein
LQLILKRFELRVASYGLKYCELNAAVHDSQRVTRNAQRKNESNTPVSGAKIFKNF